MLKTVAHASLVPLRGLLTRRVVLPRIEFSRAFRPEPREQPEQHSAYASEPLDTIVNAGVFRRRPKRLIPPGEAAPSHPCANRAVRVPSRLPGPAQAGTALRDSSSAATADHR